MDNKSPHILGTSANLLGFTFLVLASIKGLGLSEHGLADEITGLCVILFASSSLLSFISMRFANKTGGKNYEMFADIVFMAGLVMCLILSFLLVFEVVKL